MSSEKSHRVSSDAKWSEKSIYEGFRRIGVLLVLEIETQRFFHSGDLSWNDSKIIQPTRILHKYLQIGSLLMRNWHYMHPQPFGEHFQSAIRHFVEIGDYHPRFLAGPRSKYPFELTFHCILHHQIFVVRSWKCQKSHFQDILDRSWPYDFFLSSSGEFRWGVPFSKFLQGKHPPSYFKWHYTGPVYATRKRQ